MQIKITSVRKYLASGMTSVPVSAVGQVTSDDNITELTFTMVDPTLTFINSTFSVSIKNSTQEFELGAIYNLSEVN